MMGHENGTAAGQVGHPAQGTLAFGCPTPKENGTNGTAREGSKDPPDVSRGTGQPSAVELAMRVLSGTQDRPEYLCLDCGQPADERTLFCTSCWTRRREAGRLLAFDPDRRARAETRLKGTLCTVHGPATAWTVNARGDAWCSLCLPPGGPR
jgi:hypothetical protein